MKKTRKTITTISLLINILGIVIAGLLFIKIGGFDYFSREVIAHDENPYYVERTSLFSEVSIPESSTILIGDSITQRGLWDELFPSFDVINRGINSDRTEGVINRLDYITSSNPENIFLMIGINDLYAERSVKDIVSNYDTILQKIKTESPNATVYVQSVLPLNYEMYFAGDKIKNESIQELNIELILLAEKFDYTFIDLYTEFEKDGQLDERLSFDGIHLNGKGYNVWKESIEEFII